MQTVTAQEPTPPTELQELSDEGDRPSITDVNGTVARFEMAYSPAPKERHPFGVPLRTRLPSLVYLACGVAIVAIVASAYSSSGSGRLYEWIVEGDRGRPIASPVLSFIILVSAVATVIRSHMRGVIVHGDGLECRDVLALGVPSVRKWAWPQIHRIVVDDARTNPKVAVELWDGSYVTLPEVTRGRDLADLLERIGAGRRIATTRLARR